MWLTWQLARRMTVPPGRIFEMMNLPAPRWNNISPPTPCRPPPPRRHRACL
jgi:hypothetical protein